jgi:nitrite reductase/ring-hydroxylating ferredoxin subunit
MSRDVELEWHMVARLDEIGADEPRPVDVGSYEIALFRVENKIFATSNVCTHQFAYLSSGYIEGDVVECPLHQARFHIPTGKALCSPAEEDLQVFPVRVEEDRVFVGIPNPRAN